MPEPCLKPFTRRYPYTFEVLPVPTDLVDRYWRHIESTCYRTFKRKGDPKRLDYDTAALYVRARAGVDQVWLVIRFLAGSSDYHGVIVTSITEKPPTKRRVFWRDPTARKSITIHLVNGRMIESWIDQAVERITAYAQENECRQAFLLARRNWQIYAARFFGHFVRLGFSRDRVTARGPNRWANRIGWFRELVPVRPDGNRDRERQLFAYSTGATHVAHT